jgi:hypothetical protein
LQCFGIFSTTLTADDWTWSSVKLVTNKSPSTTLFRFFIPLRTTTGIQIEKESEHAGLSVRSFVRSLLEIHLRETAAATIRRLLMAEEEEEDGSRGGRYK